MRDITKWETNKIILFIVLGLALYLISSNINKFLTDKITNPIYLIILGLALFIIVAYWKNLKRFY